MKIITSVYNIEELSLNSDGYILNLEHFSEIKGNIKLKDITNIKKSKEIFLNLNKIIHNKELKDLRTFLIKIKNHQIDGILFGDLSVLQICNEENIKIPLVWNQTHLVTNYQTGNYYQKKGIKKALLSSELNLQEIKEFKQKSKLDIMVNIFGYQSMFKSYRKVLSNYFNHLKKKKSVENYYLHEKVNNEDYLINEDEGTNIFSSYILNGLEELPLLVKEGIDYFVINTYHLPQAEISIIIDSYKNYLNKSSKDNLQKLNLNLSKGFFYKSSEYKVKNHE